MPCNLTQHAMAHSTPFAKLFSLVQSVFETNIKKLEVKRKIPWKISSIMPNWHHSDSFSGSYGDSETLKNIVWTLFQGFLNFL